jgi:hypothetical protein
MDNPSITPGPIILFGSGETLPSSGPAYDFIAREMARSLDISILETPAGFQNNSEIVVANVATFLKQRLSNYHPHTHLIPARAKGTENSPDDPLILEPMLASNWIFMGPGSPTYTVRQLSNSLAMKYLCAMHYNGAALTLSSAAVLAISTLTLPVYEIYKVGQDLHWVNGLDFFGIYGQNIVFIPHWNNKDGGSDLDTSRCFMGLERFKKLEEMLPPEVVLVGIDEQTAICIVFQGSISCSIFGKGSVTVTKEGHRLLFPKGKYDLKDLGLNLIVPKGEEFIDEFVWNIVTEIQNSNEPEPTPLVKALAIQRESARKKKNWEQADLIRKKINNFGWDVKDTPDGPIIISQ